MIEIVNTMKSDIIRRSHLCEAEGEDRAVLNQNLSDLGLKAKSKVSTKCRQSVNKVLKKVTVK